MKNMHYHIFNLICCLSVIFSGCTDSQGPTSGNGSDVGNGAVAGKVYNPGGSPAVNATVKVITVDHNPQPGLQENISITDSTITDKNGNYSIDSLSKGQYNILYSGDSGVAFNDSVYIDGDSITEELSDTLKDPGSIYGVVRLRPNHNSKTVFILVFGTNTFTVPMDSIGNFSLTGIAEGEYNVTILTTIPDYNTLDTSFNIISGKNDTLSDTIRLDYHGIPIPTGLKIEYDTMKQIVTLTWDQADTSLVKGYHISRKHSDSDFVKINTVLITDTIFSDSTAIQDQTYDYKIIAVDMNYNEGEFSNGVSVVVVSGFESADTIINLGSDIGTFALDSKGFIYLTNMTSEKIEVFDSSGQKIREWNTPTRLASPSRDNNIAINSQDEIYLYTYYDNLTIYDTLGNIIGGFSDNLGSCEGIVLLNDNIYIAVEQPDRNILVFDSSGSPIDTINHNWDTEDNFSSLDVDSSGNLYLHGEFGTNTSNRSYKMEVLDSIGNFINEMFVGHDFHHSIVSLSGNRILVTSSQGSLNCFDFNENLIFKFNIPDNAVKSILLPEGDLLVCFMNGKIVKFSPQL